MRNKLQLSPKVAPKVSIKNTLVAASIGAGLFILIATGAFFYFNLGNTEKAMAAAAFTSRDNRKSDWDQRLDWVGNSTPGANVGQNISVDIYGNVKRTGDLSFAKGASISINDTLLITGNLSLDKDANLSIGYNGVLIVLGNYSSDKSLSIANGGRIVIVGAVNLAKDATISNNGAIYFYDTNPSYAKGFIASGDPIQDENDLKNNDPTLFKFVNGDNSLLPIVLDYFNATVSESHSVLITWGTVTEKQNDFFTLEKSIDGKTFEEVTTISGAGNSNKKLSYSFEDNNTTAGMIYYRLKQTDFNGDFEYFKIVGVNNPLASSSSKSTSTGNEATITIEKAWPNPFKDHISLSFTSKVDGDVEIIIQNATGAFVSKVIFSAYAGENTYDFNSGAQLKPGIYFINIWSNGKKFQPQRLIKM